MCRRNRLPNVINCWTVKGDSFRNTALYILVLKVIVLKTERNIDFYDEGKM